MQKQQLSMRYKKQRSLIHPILIHNDISIYLIDNNIQFTNAVLIQKSLSK